MMLLINTYAPGGRQQVAVVEDPLFGVGGAFVVSRAARSKAAATACEIYEKK